MMQFLRRWLSRGKQDDGHTVGASARAYWKREVSAEQTRRGRSDRGRDGKPQ